MIENNLKLKKEEYNYGYLIILKRAFIYYKIDIILYIFNINILIILFFSII